MLKIILAIVLCLAIAWMSMTSFYLKVTENVFYVNHDLKRQYSGDSCLQDGVTFTNIEILKEVMQRG